MPLCFRQRTKLLLTLMEYLAENVNKAKVEKPWPQLLTLPRIPFLLPPSCSPALLSQSGEMLFFFQALQKFP